MQHFEDWYRRLHPRVLAIVAVTCGDADVACDSVDEAFTRALDRWEKVSTMSSPDAWVYRVALNVMRRRFNRRLLERRLLMRRVVAPPPAEGELHPELWAHVGHLPERQRMAVLLRYVGDLTEAEVAGAMGISRGAVSASLAAARSRLASGLGREYMALDEESPYA